jgi:hypothetical protein
MQPVIDFDNHRFVITQVCNPYPRTKRQHITCAGQFALAEDFTICSSAALEFIGIKTGDPINDALTGKPGDLCFF